MKKFEFRLAAVLRLQETQLTAEKTKLQELFAERDSLLKNLASIDAERKESVDWVTSSEGKSSADLRALSSFLLGSQARQSTMRQAIETCRVDIDEQRGCVMAAERKQKLLLKLKEKRLANWQYEYDRELEALAQEAWQSAARQKADKILASNS